ARPNVSEEWSLTMKMRLHRPALPTSRIPTTMKTTPKNARTGLRGGVGGEGGGLSLGPVMDLRTLTYRRGGARIRLTPNRSNNAPGKPSMNKVPKTSPVLLVQ